VRTFESSVTRLKIRQKLALLTAIPLIAVLVFAALAVVTTGRQALDAERLRTMVVANSAAGDLMFMLQAERNSAVRLLVGKEDPELADEYHDAVTNTDDARDAYDEVRAELTDAPTSTTSALDRIDTELERLDSVRERVSGRDQAASAAAFSYRITISELLSYRETVPQAVASEAADRIRASNLLARTIENLSIENVAVLRAISTGDLSEAAQEELLSASTGVTESSLSFNSLADPQWRQLVKQAQSGKEMSDARALEDEALRTSPGSKLNVDAADWTESMTWRVEQLQEVQERVDKQIISDVTDLRDEQYRLTAAQIGGVLVAVIIALILAIRLGGPVVRGLRRLRETAHRVASEDLPRTVAQLDDHHVLGEQSPEEFAREATPPVRIEGRDELADVGRAFNEVHQEAIRVAAHQALLRLHIGAMFVRLARRGHSLNGRLTAGLDEAERNEQDPERLDRLFRLDHLVTLLGRTNDSLLVLGGASPAKARVASETAASVLTAAQGQIEQYQRVQITAVDEGFSVKANVVDDVVKLLAELFDNATRYSDQPVNVTARLLADRMVIQIYDRGIGIDAERMKRLNARLAVRTALDLEAFQAMGLTVVGHLAAEHGIKVELRAVATGGVLAEVSLPGDLLEQANPLALPAGSNADATSKADTRRGAPLFSRGRRRRRKTDTEKVPRQREPGRALSGGSRYQMVPHDRLPADARRTAPDESMPVLRFDYWRGTDGEKIDMAHTATQPAVDTGSAKGDSSRPRMMSFRDHDDLNSGWQSAKRAYEPPAEVPDNGLPKREPMARLVPGAIETSVESRPQAVLPTYRDPEAVGATYAAYVKARGRKRARPNPNRSRKTT
jgi:HAMP domain-containing protein